ncbi:MAG: hypothetical protein Q9M26_04650 [Mariprofundales bacterium]|nr:hypothetical protein [Mariprofundales bacterium]
MAKKLTADTPTSVASKGENADNAQGFVLITVIILLALLTMLGVGQVYRSITNQQESATSVMNTRAVYYAETGISYLEWSWASDADFDAYSAVAGMPADDTSNGDREEWLAGVTTPGPTTATGVDGKVMYWDNTPMAGRAVCWPNALCNGGNSPTMYHISTKLTRYIKLEINQTTGAITPSIPVVPHADPPVAGTDTPQNGAIVWLTAGDGTTDYEVANHLCTNGSPDQGCFKTTAGSADTPYHVIAYSIGYVNGRALHLLRAVIQ